MAAVTTIRPDGGVWIDISESPPGSPCSHGSPKRQSVLVDLLGEMSPDMPNRKLEVDLGEFTPDEYEDSANSSPQAPVPAVASQAPARSSAPQQKLPRSSSFVRTFANFTGLAEGHLAEVREQLRAEVATVRATRQGGLAQRSVTKATATRTPQALSLEPQIHATAASSTSPTHSSGVLSPNVEVHTAPSREVLATSADRLTLSVQPTSTCSEPFPEPPSYCRMTAGSRLAAKLPIRDCEAATYEGSTASTTEAPLGPPVDSPPVIVGASGVGLGQTNGCNLVTLEAVRDELARFKTCGGQELLGLKEDVKALLESQEEAERLASQVASLMVAESQRTNLYHGIATVA